MKNVNAAVEQSRSNLAANVIKQSVMPYRKSTLEKSDLYLSYPLRKHDKNKSFLV